MPTKKLIKHDVISENVLILIALEFRSNSAIMSEPIIIGILRRNEKVVTSSLSPFKIRPVAIVVPLLLILVQLANNLEI